MNVNATVASICSASTNWIQSTCLQGQATAQAAIVPVEAITFSMVALSALSLFSQCFSFTQFIKRPAPKVREMNVIDDPEIPAVIEPPPEQRNILLRIHLLIRTINEIFLTVVLGIALEFGRRTATPEECQYSADFFNNMCSQILSNVWHRFFPGSYS